MNTRTNIAPARAPSAVNSATRSVHLVTIGKQPLKRSARTDQAGRTRQLGVIWPRAGYWACART
jgi:hypothetical protein